MGDQNEENKQLCQLTKWKYVTYKILGLEVRLF